MFVLMSPEAARTARELQMLETMVDCAHVLGMAFGEAAQAETDTRRSLELLDAFQKSFLALRMGIRLSVTLRAPPKSAPAPAPERDSPERDSAECVEAPEHDPAERDPPERGDGVERERDYEPVSLPKFLATLGVVARDAARLDDRLPTDAARILPELQGLLARATADPPAPEPAPSPAAPSQATGVAVLVRPPGSGTRRLLLGSAAPSLPKSSLPRSAPRRPPPWSGSG